MLVFKFTNSTKQDNFYHFIFKINRVIKKEQYTHQFVCQLYSIMYSNAYFA